MSQSETLSTGTFQRRPNDGQRPTVPPTFGFGANLQQQQEKVRQRVRRPPNAFNQPQEITVPEGPPTFALSSDEDIQVSAQ